MTAAEINERLKKVKSDKIKTYPCHNLRASNLGHPCERYLYLLLTKWEEQKPHDAGLQSIFDLGNELEPYAFKQLRDAGYEVVTPTQRSWKIETPLISGREDCRIKEEDGQLIPVEVKWLSPNEYEKLNTIDDFYNSKKYYVRAYPAQLMCYMWKFGKEKSYFCIGNKLTGEMKLIDVKFDWEYADSLFKKAERIYKAKVDDIAPEPIEDESVCGNCSLQHICGHMTRIPLDIELDGELEELIIERNSLKENATKYDDLLEEIKKRVGDREKILAGKYLIKRSCTTKPAHHKEAEDIPEKTTWRINIKQI